MAWLFPPIIARGKVRDLPKRGVYHGIRIGWLEIQMSLKCDKSVEFSSDILTHLLLVFFIQLGNRYLAPFSLSATAFKKKIILSWSKFFQRNYHPIDPSRVTARRSKARCDTGTWGLVKAYWLFQYSKSRQWSTIIMQTGNILHLEWFFFFLQLMFCMILFRFFDFLNSPTKTSPY